MSTTISDALVLSGATGNLVFKKIYPALQALVGRGQFDMPLICVARSGWDADRMRARIRESLEHHGKVDEAACAKLSTLLRYVDGDYRESSTFARLCDALGEASHPAFYLAIPPSMFPSVVESLSKLNCSSGARIVVEKWMPTNA
ncbi:MAG: hypothetical protein WA056_02565 [Gallionella sp.]